MPISPETRWDHADDPAITGIHFPMNFFLKFCAALLLAMLAACDLQDAIAKMVPADEMAFARAILKSVETKQFDMLEAHSSPTLKPKLDTVTLNQIANAFPAEKPASVEPLIATVSSTTDSHADEQTTYDLTFRYTYPQSTLLANIVFATRGTDHVVESLYVYPHAEALEKTNAFTFRDKGWQHFLVFALVIGLPIFVAGTLVVCLRTRGVKRKGLWMLFIVLGVVQVTFNWTTGAFVVQPARLMLFSAGFMDGGPFSPLFLQLAIPIGAIVFLAKHQGLRSPS